MFWLLNDKAVTPHPLFLFRLKLSNHLYAILIASDSNMETRNFLSLYTTRPSCEYYLQVYFVHYGLQDENLQITISSKAEAIETAAG